MRFRSVDISPDRERNPSLARLDVIAVPRGLVRAKGGRTVSPMSALVESGQDKEMSSGRVCGASIPSAMW